MGINSTPVVENGTMNIRGVKVKLLATLSQTWDVTINGATYHITQEQEASLLRTVLYHNDNPSPYRIAQLIHSGKERRPPSPAKMAQMVIISHTCIDDTNSSKPCSESFEIRGYGYMNKWQSFRYCFPHAIAILFWSMIAILMWNIAKWLFQISRGTDFSVDDSVCQSFTILVCLTVVELCFKSGRNYLRQFFNSKILWCFIFQWLGFVLVAAIERHKNYADQSDNFLIALAPLIAILGSLLFMFMSALTCYCLVCSVLEEGKDIDTIDKYA